MPRTMDRSIGRRLAGAIALLALTWAIPAALAQGAPRITQEGPREVLWLDRMNEPANWSPVEECQAQASELPGPVGGKALLLRVGIDHQGGEKAYPVGWPRAHFVPKESEADWSAWDAFEVMVQVRFVGAKRPAKPFSLEIGEARPTFTLIPDIPQADAWIPLAIPVAEVLKGRPELATGVPRVRVVVSESNYKDKDVVELHFGGFRLTRSLSCEITAFAAAAPVIFAGQPVVKLDVTVVGPPEQVKRGVPFTLRRKGAAAVVRREMLPLGRGQQVYPCDISELDLAPGDYELAVFDEDPAKRKAVDLRVVAEPWKQE